jgi:hypothetical protein
MMCDGRRESAKRGRMRNKSCAKSIRKEKDLIGRFREIRADDLSICEAAV